MSGSGGDELPPGLFRVRAEHCPRTKDELHERLNFYASWMGVAASDALYECLMRLREAAPKVPDDAVREIALKGYSDEEYARAVKEIVCIWFHLEVMDQGGYDAAPWLLSFLRMAFSASDYLIESPPAIEVMHAYEDHGDTVSMCRLAAVRVCSWLGFGDYAPGFAVAVERTFFGTAPQRQQILEEALTLPVETIRSRPLP